MDKHAKSNGDGTVGGLQGDVDWMRQALAVATQAGQRNEVPVGAVIVQNGAIIGAGANATEASQDPTAHAELLAIRQAVKAAGTRWLSDATLYVTLEPCAMCAGAIVLARLKRLVFGAYDAKTGACASLRNIVQDLRLNHRCQLSGGILQDECGALLSDFFVSLRHESK